VLDAGPLKRRETVDECVEACIVSDGRLRCPGWTTAPVEPEAVHCLLHRPVVCFEPDAAASEEKVGGDDASSSVSRAIAEVMLWVGIGEVFVLQERKREDVVSDLGWQFLEERRLQLLVAFCDVLGCRVGFDAEHSGWSGLRSLCFSVLARWKPWCSLV
jgi:hypothetical protein